ncbi:MAG TPA: L,D-transpeptidase family protein [Acidimicrobiia bacterium]|nr:L,D-transpeptidase family protein [Acidimicrobiia bacterium]
MNFPMLGPGASGPLVVALQRRLSTLGYWLDDETGVFDDATEQAVFAIQKTAGLARDGVVGPATESALIRGVQPRPRSSSGHVVEVDLTDDLLLIVTDGHLDATLNTSTGGGYAYRSRGQHAIADTPEGRFRIYRQVDGLVVNSLGELWRPKFFDDGFAIHGDSYVPPRPVSHGCVRVSNEAIDWIWARDVMPLGTPVWVY